VAAHSLQRFVLADFDGSDVRQASSVFYDDWERRTPVMIGSNVVLSPEDYTDSVVAAANRAVLTLDIMANSITSSAVTQALVAAARRGVTVRALLDPGVPPYLVQSLQQNGIVVRLLPAGFSGSALSVDNARLLIGSASLADDALQQDRQMGVMVKNLQVSAVFGSVFGYAWRAAAPINTPTPSATPTTAPTSTNTPIPTKTPIPTRTPVPTRTPKGYHPPKTPTPRPFTPTRTPVPSHTPTPPRPTATPVPSATPSTITLSVDYGPSVRIGSRESILVHTLPGATVTVKVTYPDGTTSNPGTKSGVADATGTFTDSWPISMTVNPGPASASVAVALGKLRKSATVGFTITF
jgi:hypothetical protein